MKDLLNKIHHADCLEFMKDLPDKCIDLVLTDPPYGVGFQSNRREEKFDCFNLGFVYFPYPILDID